MKKLGENKTINIEEWTKLPPSKIKNKYGISKLSIKDFDLANKIKDKVKVKQLSNGIEIQTTSYVGIIKFDNFQLNIKPKIKNIHLMKMIAFSYELNNIYFIDEQNYLNKRQSLISDIISFLFLKEAERIYSKGLIKRYKKVNQDISGCKGKIDFKKLALNQDTNFTLPCTFEKLTVDVAENQLILATLKILLNNTKDTKLKKNINKMILRMIREVSNNELNKNLLLKAKESNDRLSNNYGRLIEIAEMIFNNLDFSYEDGNLKYQLFLIDMNDLFERFLYKYFIEIISFDNNIEYQNYLNNFYTDNIDNYKLQPDFMFYKNHNLIKIADAKYKDYDNNRIQSSDLYQLTSYSLANNNSVNEIYLLYPSTEHELKRFNLTKTNIDIILEKIPLVKILDQLPELYNNFFEFCT